MNKRLSRMAGVTLLEIMLVLAIAAMIIVMSIRYYQSASLGQKVNSAIDTITGIAAASENYLNANGGYTGMTMSGLQPFLPAGSKIASPWGGAITLTGTPSASSFVISMPSVPGEGCAQMTSLLQSNRKVVISGCATTGSSGAATITFNAY